MAFVKLLGPWSDGSERQETLRLRQGQRDRKRKGVLVAENCTSFRALRLVRNSAWSNSFDMVLSPDRICYFRRLRHRVL